MLSDASSPGMVAAAGIKSAHGDQGLLMQVPRVAARPTLAAAATSDSPIQRSSVSKNSLVAGSVSASTCLIGTGLDTPDHPVPLHHPVGREEIRPWSS